MPETEPAQWPTLHGLPGWQPLYLQLQADVTELDPCARISAKQKFGMLSLHVHEAYPAVVQPIRELCSSAEAESMRTCQACGAPGALLGAPERRWVRTLCDEHDALPAVELHAALFVEEPEFDG